MTIRKRLALWYSGLIIAVIIILSLVVVGISRVTILNTIDQVLQETASDVIDGIVIASTPSGDGSVEPTVILERNELFGAAGIAIQVWQTHNSNGPLDEPVLLLNSVNISNTIPLDEDALKVTELFYSTRQISHVTERVISQPFNSNKQQIGIVQVASTIQPVQHANDALIVITIIAAVISAIIAIISSLWIADRALRPVNRITEAAASIAAAEDLSTRLTWEGPVDELGRLSNVFNHMMERLERLFAVQQRFVGDVSHELRTPLTSIMGNLELMARYGYDEESLQAVHREAERMSRMVNDLLMLARADNGEILMELNPTDLESITLDVYQQADVLVKKRNLHVKLGRLEPARIDGHYDRLKQVMLNLLSNAIKFTEDGGAITLSTYTEDDLAVFTITDTGIGINKQDQQHIFDRFYQADYSRTQRDENDGAGLGLSIAWWIVKAHHGEISVSSEIGKGTTFRLTFPLLPATKQMRALERSSAQV
ncbi:MAG: HAMP domain-containing histidine kinase [Anaerolineae bacterium]|nr:HAMP domain-containing histidine kinase [Anaerolineae bacterium]